MSVLDIFKSSVHLAFSNGGNGHLDVLKGNVFTFLYSLNIKLFGCEESKILLKNKKSSRSIETPLSSP